MSDDAIITLDSISKTYGDFQALQDINLVIRPGTVTCVLGDNGAGKSTLTSRLCWVKTARASQP